MHLTNFSNIDKSYNHKHTILLHSIWQSWFNCVLTAYHCLLKDTRPARIPIITSFPCPPPHLELRRLAPVVPMG